MDVLQSSLMVLLEGTSKHAADDSSKGRKSKLNSFANVYILIIVHTMIHVIRHKTMVLIVVVTTYITPLETTL